MILTINGKNYELTFGLGFLAEMNKRKPAELEGMKTGYGAMALFNVGQLLGDPLAYTFSQMILVVELPNTNNWTN